MDLGIRQIRTAGKGSGSIELTLPTELRDLVGLPCRILLSDGTRPDIVLQPDLGQARAAFGAIWRAMAAILLADDPQAAEFPLAAFGFALQPRSTGGERPFLSWRDGIALAGRPPHDASAIARTISAFGQVLAGPLHIEASLAASFGAAASYLLTGVATLPEGQEARDLVADAMRPVAVPPEIAASGSLSDGFWQYAAPKLTAVAELFLGWTADPSGYATLRAAWRRGRALEMSGG
jgi:hypothetical protein